MNPRSLERLRRVVTVATAAWGGRRFPVPQLRPFYQSFLERAAGQRGLVVQLNGRERFHIDPRHRQNFPESYDPDVLGYLRRAVRPGSVCLDVGAHFGIYSLSLATFAGDRGRVFAFEPNPATRAILERHIAWNHLDSRIEVIPMAVAAQAGHAEFYAAATEGTSRLISSSPEFQPTQRIQVDITTIDEFCEARRIEPDLIKLDIEGYEIAALEGAQRLLARADVDLIVELHPAGWSPAGGSRATLESLLHRLGRTPIALTGQVDPLGEYGIARLARRP